jgi:hypothetical protein
MIRRNNTFSWKHVSLKLLEGFHFSLVFNNKNFRKLKYVPGNPQNAGFCTIYPTASGGLGRPPA